MRPLAAALLLWIAGPGAAAADACAPGAQITLSDRVVAERFGLSLQVRVGRDVRVDDIAFATVAAQEDAVFAVVEDLLAGVGPAERDARLIGLYISFLRLDHDYPSAGDVRFVPAYIDLFLPVLDRNDMPIGAAALRIIRRSFTVWDAGKIDLFLRQGMIDRAVHGSLSDAHHEAERLLLEAKQEADGALAALMAAEPAVASLMAQNRVALHVFNRLRYLNDRLATCLTDGLDTPRGTADWRALPRAQADLILLDRFRDALSNDEIVSFIAETGHLVPDLRTILERREMWLFAEALGRMTEIFPDGLPEDPEARWDIVTTEAAWQHIDEAYFTHLIDPLERTAPNHHDGVFADLMIAHEIYEMALDAGLWPL